MNRTPDTLNLVTRKNLPDILAVAYKWASIQDAIERVKQAIRPLQQELDDLNHERSATEALAMDYDDFGPYKLATLEDGRIVAFTSNGPRFAEHAKGL